MLFRKRKARLLTRARQSAESGFAAVDRRLPTAELAQQLMRKVFPDHWSFYLGEIALYSFVVLVITGTYLTFFFDPSMTETIYHGTYAPLRGLRVTQAYRSTVDISFDVRGGLLIRQMHHWAALVFLAAIGVHMLRIFFTGAFRRPREANWLIGVTLFLLSLLEGFCGYSLPGDLLSGTGLKTANTIVLSIPVVGTYLAFFIWRGLYPGHQFLARLYIVHVLLVPGLLIALIGVHLFLVVYLKHTQWAGRGKTNRNVVGHPMFPRFIASSAGLSLMVFGILAAMAATAQINPIWEYGPYVTDQIATDAQPDWYVGFLEGALRIMPPWENNVAGHTLMWNVLVPAVVTPALLFLVLYMYPFFEQWVTGDRLEHHVCDRPRDRPTRTAFGVAATVFYADLLLAGGNDVIAYSFHVSVNALTWIFRVFVVLGPVLSFVITKRACLALQAHDHQLLVEGEETGRVYQSIYGEIGEPNRPLTADQRYDLLVRDIPRPLPAPVERRVPRRERLRLTLNAWYYRDYVEMPATAWERSQIERRYAEPVAEAVAEPED